jgi:hypothetical protein
MGRCHKPRRLAAALIALCIAGCNSNYIVQASSAGASQLPATGGSVSVYGSSTAGALFAIGFLGALFSGGAAHYSVPEMNPERRVIEQDCSKPIEDPSANLRCR